MLGLILFELQKIWRKRSFLLAIGILMAAHVFLLWYTTLPQEGRPGLSSYRALQQELSQMSQKEKGAFLEEWKESVEGVCFVEQVLAMQGFGNEMGEMLARQELESHPGLFEAYYEISRSGAYLRFTDSLEKEKALLDEIYGEWQEVDTYGAYLASIQENRDTLGQISIFGGQEKTGYSPRNLEKSARDYQGLTDEGLTFIPSKALTLATENHWTKVLLFLALLFGVGSLITQEKERGLFLVTRSTRYGIGPSIGAKLAALMCHCLLTTALFYGAGLLFSGQWAGWFDLTAKLQSVSLYRESCLEITIGGYLVLGVVTQAMVMFGVGAVLVAVSLSSRIAALPFLAGVGAAGISGLCYYLIPAGSPLAALKYLNPVGLMETGQLYGGYLNFNVLGYPISRLWLSLGCLGILIAGGLGAGFAVFGGRRAFELKKLRLPVRRRFRPHTSILRHESYKLLIANRGLLFLTVFALLLAAKDAGNTYHPSGGEQYYRDIMETLEGELTQEKEELVQSLQTRFQEAFEKLEQIEAMEAEGALGPEEAEDRKAQLYMTLSFYPSFQRVEEQYHQIQERGGSFVYDTGYLYLLGVWEDAFSVDFLILTMGIILTVSGAVSMEDQKGSWYLLGATRAGRRSILLKKCLICTLEAGALSLVPILCRAASIAAVYPMGSLNANVGNILHFSGIPSGIPIVVFLGGFVLAQMAAAVLIAWITLALSAWRKQQAQTIFFGLALLAAPAALKLLGFEAAKWCSLYPLYAWTGM